ncbi:MAG: hypothetical protein JRH18_09805 [Deltaproteobacteria bacterium]|nr:hypothetical protein [Deltaproteobacteria bacterium]MBW2151948.1 hypothetical protein [Deltaproteobacteria bacterium]
MIKKKQHARGLFKSIVMVIIVFLMSSFHFIGKLHGSEPMEHYPAKIDSANLIPGLAVLYFYEFWARHLDALPAGEKAVALGKPGAPIPYLNHKFGRGKVFGSGERRGVGMQMDGYLNMLKPGEYWFKALANDGIRVFVNNQLVVDDPGWHKHGDRYSEPLSIKIAKPGWFPVRVRYFQRKGTATLKLYWKKPQDKKFTIIPPKAYAHTTSQGVKK